MYSVTDLEKEIITRFGWKLVDAKSTAKGLMYLMHPLLHGEATMAIPVNLAAGSLTQSVATAARTFNVQSWIQNADVSKYPDDPYISLETRITDDANYAQRELRTLCSALGIL